MNKLHATDSRTPPDAAAILASIHCPVTRTWIAGLVKTFMIRCRALKHSSCLTSGFVLAAHGSPFSDLWRGTVPHAIAPPEGARNPVRPPPIELCAQSPTQPGDVPPYVETFLAALPPLSR